MPQLRPQDTRALYSFWPKQSRAPGRGGTSLTAVQRWPE